MFLLLIWYNKKLFIDALVPYHYALYNTPLIFHLKMTHEYLSPVCRNYNAGAC